MQNAAALLEQHAGNPVSGLQYPQDTALATALAQPALLTDEGHVPMPPTHEWDIHRSMKESEIAVCVSHISLEFPASHQAEVFSQDVIALGEVPGVLRNM